MKVSALTTAVLFSCALVTLAAKWITEFTKVECKIQHPETMVALNCYINQTSKNTSGLYFEFEFVEDLANLNGVFTLGIERGGKYFNYSATELDYCEALHALHSQYWIQMVAEGLRRVSNFPWDCPFKKNVRYSSNGFTVDPKKFRRYMTSISFRTDASFAFKQRNLFHLTTFGRVVRK